MEYYIVDTLHKLYCISIGLATMSSIGIVIGVLAVFIEDIQYEKLDTIKQVAVLIIPCIFILSLILITFVPNKETLIKIFGV